MTTEQFVDALTSDLIQRVSAIEAILDIPPQQNEPNVIAGAQNVLNFLRERIERIENRLTKNHAGDAQSSAGVTGVSSLVGLAAPCPSDELRITIAFDVESTVGLVKALKALDE